MGGVAERADFGFEEMDDLQLAIERLLAEAGGEGASRLTFELSPGRIGRTIVGPLRERGLARRAPGPERRARARSRSRRVLDTVVDSYGVEDARRRRDRRAPGEAGGGAPVRAAEDAAQGPARDEDRELLRRYHEDGDEAAREQLVQRHLPLVRSLARRYANRGEPLEDIEQVGAIGLLKAIDRFELDRDVSLATYATPNVVGEIKRHFRDKGWAIRVPRALQELNARMSRTIDRLTARLGRSPSIAEIAAELGATPEEVLEALEVGSAYTHAVAVGRAGGEEDGRPAGGRSAARTRSFERTEDRASLGARARRSCPRASARSCACASRRASRRPRSPSGWGCRRCTCRG